MTSSNWIYLSYIASDQISSYGNGKRIKTDIVKSIEKKNSCNESFLSLPTHFGTHVDFPYHFGNHGRSGDSYQASDFISRFISYITLIPKNGIISPNDLNKDVISQETEFLFVNTGYWTKRYSDSYWNDNPGFHPDCASFLKSRCPKIRLVAFDSISMSPWKNRELGRVAHKEFLIKNEIMIVEDVDYTYLPKKSCLKRSHYLSFSI